MKAYLVPKGVKDKRLTVRPTLEQMRAYNIHHYKGIQYRYIYFVCDKREKKRLLRECIVDVNQPNPKDKDLVFTEKDLTTGKWVKTGKPPYITDVDKDTKILCKQ